MSLPNFEKLDYLFFGVHPDDVELSCSGTILLHVQRGKKIGIIDLTAGELGSRGSAEIRVRESEEAARLLGVSLRENLGLRDGFFENNEASQRKVIEVIRRYRPSYIFANTPQDRHPDHGRASRLVTEASFLSGLQKVETKDKNGNSQGAWRASSLFYYIQDRWMDPDFVLDVSAVHEKKMKAILAYASQFHNSTYVASSTDAVSTYISTPDFMQSLESRFRAMGKLVGVPFGEGYLSAKRVGLSDFDSLLDVPF